MPTRQNSNWSVQAGVRIGALAWALGAASCGGSNASPASGSGVDGDGSVSTTPRSDASVKRTDAGGSSTPSGRSDSGGDTVPASSDGGGSGPGPVNNSDAGGPPVVVGPVACDATAAPDVGKLGLQVVPGATGLSKLVTAAQPPGSSDWYFLEQAGTLRVLTGGALKPTPFLDLSSMISLMPGGLVDDERGLLGMAFAPDYATSGIFYVMFTPSTNRDTVLEFKRSSADPYVADPTPTKMLLQLPMSAFNHDGGNIIFGPDGMLYIGTGDGGGGCNDNQPGAPQDTKKQFGKILRLDPKAPAPYGAADNPFADGSAGDPLVLHYGLRNPYKFAFDKATGDLYIGDVGQDSYEEVDFAPSGAKKLNFGWPAIEGTHMGTCAGKTLAAGAMATAPIFEADRRAGQTGPYSDWTSVMGGQVYRGSALPQLQGVYLFGDYRGRRMIALRQCGSTTSPLTPILKKKDPNQNIAAFVSVGGAPALADLTAIIADNDGEIYLVADRSTLLKVVAAP